MNITNRLLFIACLGLPVSCVNTQHDIVRNNFDFAAVQLSHAFEEIDSVLSQESQEDIRRREEKKSGGLTSPRTIDKNGNLYMVLSRDWTSGFFAGELWYMYEYTQGKEWEAQARKFTEMLEREKTNATTHDMGFKIFCSFGNGYRLTGDRRYKDVVMEAAYTLAKRYNPTVGAIRSWDHSRSKWDFPVIIDNMMNLELLLWAFGRNGDSTLYNIAVNHARTTTQNHFRPDFGTYHVIDYDTLSGNVTKRNTHQGFAHESTWARGEAWALYGYTMCYRYTRLPEFLAQAENIAGFIFNNRNLPTDLIPYWDFDAADIPNEPRDASAGTITASALYELSIYSAANGAKYRQLADRMLDNITNHYRAPKGSNRGFLLQHSTGSKPSDLEVDVPLVYTDYYFLEALLRKKRLEEGAETKDIFPI